MKTVTGIGGMFFKSEDSGKLKEWHREHPGSHVTSYEVPCESDEDAVTKKLRHALES